MFVTLKTVKNLSRALAALALFMTGAAGSAVLSVERAAGVSVMRMGQMLTLDHDLVLQEGDQISAAGGRAALKIDRYGSLELGPGAVMVVERLPFASYASELNTELRLDAGYMRVLWKRSGKATPWPLAVQLAGVRLTLSSGEYFFDASTQGAQLCVAGGEAALAGEGGSTLFDGPACYQLADGAPGQRSTRAGADFIAMRSTFSLGGNSALGVAAPIELPPAWLLNVISTIDSPSAEREAARLRAAGYTPQVQAVTVKARQWYRVRLEFATRAEALATAKKIQTLGYANAWIMKL